MAHLAFLSDNRTNPNWGCRATSIALGDVLSASGHSFTSVYGQSKHLRVPAIFGPNRAYPIPGVITRRLENASYRFTKKPLFANSDSWQAKLLDFAIPDEGESLRRFRDLSKV